MTKKEQVAEVLGTELPWLQEDLLEFADKIIKVTDALYKEKYLGMLPEEIEDYCQDESGNAYNAGFNSAIQEIKEKLTKWECICLTPRKEN
jgi:hypothetical protein